MTIAKSRKEVFLEEIVDNLTGNSKELPVDCKPKSREEILLAEIEKNTRNSSLEGGVDLSNYYNKDEINNLLNELRDLINGSELPPATVDTINILLSNFISKNSNYIVSDDNISIDEVHNLNTTDVSTGVNYTNGTLNLAEYNTVKEVN